MVSEFLSSGLQWIGQWTATDWLGLGSGTAPGWPEDIDTL